MNEFKPNVLSDVLLAEYVLKKEENERFKLDERWNSFEGFDDYVILYKIALVLIALLNIERKKPNYFQVRLIFEKQIFGEGDLHDGDIWKKVYVYSQVKSAMDRLGELLDTKNYKLDNLRDQNEKMPWTMAALRTAKVLENDQGIMHNRQSVIGFGWSMAWLKEAGITEINPVKLSQFSWMWMDNYIAINNFLDECNPISP